MGALLMILGAIVFGALVLILSIRSSEYVQFSIAYFNFLIICGLTLGVLDGFGLGSVLILGTGVVGVGISVIISRTK